jgi:hypothetical protein
VGIHSGGLAAWWDLAFYFTSSSPVRCWNGKTSTPFEYSGALTESVLLGAPSTRFPKFPGSQRLFKEEVPLGLVSAKLGVGQAEPPWWAKGLCFGEI